MTICALTFVAPYYDCSEQWDIAIWDETHEFIPGTERAIGVAKFDRVFSNDRVELVHDYRDRIGMHDHLLRHQDVLWHELLHLMCECDWHEGWDREKPAIRASKVNSFNKNVPQSIQPYLVDNWRALT